MNKLILIISFLVVIAIGSVASAQIVSDVWVSPDGTVYIEVVPEYIGPFPDSYHLDLNGDCCVGQVWPGPIPGYIRNPVPRTFIWDPCDSDPRC